VRLLRDATGRFPERPYYECAELNELCEHIVESFLTRKYGSPAYPIKTDDLELLLEHEDVVLDPYSDLNQYGADTEGASVFAPDAPTRVYVSRALSQDSRRENRYRSTLAHEFGHVRLHGPLFRAVRTGDLFEAPDVSRAATCKRQRIERAPASDWLEWQAGFASGALLMPHSAVRQQAAMLLQTTPSPESAGAQALIEHVAQTFHVSRSAAHVRLQQLALIQPAKTPTLL